MEVKIVGTLNLMLDKLDLVRHVHNPNWKAGAGSLCGSSRPAWAPEQARPCVKSHTALCDMCLEQKPH